MNPLINLIVALISFIAWALKWYVVVILGILAFGLLSNLDCNITTFLLTSTIFIGAYFLLRSAPEKTA